MTIEMRRYINEMFDQNFYKLSKFEIFYDVEEFQQTTNTMNEIFIRIQFFDHFSFKKTKYQIKQFHTLNEKFV